MGANPPAESRANQPGAISAFFVYKAGLFAVGFWAWLAVLVFRGLPVSGWHILAATGAVTTTLVGVVLGVRYAIDRAAAQRHQLVMRSIVELSWYSFAEPMAPPVPPPAASPSRPETGDADVIQLSQESRPRQQRR
jgi:hypothetical protein